MDTRELEERFESRMSEHRKILYKVCNAYCANREDREDLAQEILVQLWRSFGSFDGRCLFSTWMYRVALNTAISFSRREFKRRRYVFAVEDRALAAYPVQGLETDELRMLHEIIAALDPLNKALVLLYMDGNTYQENLGCFSASPLQMPRQKSTASKKRLSSNSPALPAWRDHYYDDPR